MSPVSFERHYLAFDNACPYFKNVRDGQLKPFCDKTLQLLQWYTLMFNVAPTLILIGWSWPLRRTNCPIVTVNSNSSVWRWYHFNTAEQLSTGENVESP